MPDLAEKNYEIIISTEKENEILYRLEDEYCKVCELSIQDRKFINAIILRNRPQKALEVGVRGGGGAVVLLNALEGEKLFSIEYLDHWYKSPETKPGFIVDEYPELKKNWKLFSGGLASRFLDEIGGGIDFVMLDTMHINPGEVLDFLMILPFLTDDAIIVLHDTKQCLHPDNGYNGWALTTNLLLSCIEGKKYLPDFFSENGGFPNVAAVKINSNTKKRIFEIFNLLSVKWFYFPSEKDWKELISFLQKHYDTIFIDHLQDIYSIQKRQCTDIIDDKSAYNMYRYTVECVLSKNTKTFDIKSLEEKQGAIIFNCAGTDPQIILPFEEKLTKLPYRKYFIEIKYTNTLEGFLQVFFDFENDYSEQDSYGPFHVGEELMITKIIIPITCWNDDSNLISIRIDPPNNTTFTLIGVALLEQ